MTKIRTKLIFLLVSIVAIIIMFCFGIGVTYSKYAGNKDNKTIVSSSEFYFTSDLLTSAGSNYNLDGNQSFSIEIRNYNSIQQFNDEDTTFSVVLVGGTISGGNPINNIYTINGGSANSCLIYITPTSNSVSVTVNAISPYTHTISGEFSLSNAFSSYSISEVDVNSTFINIVFTIARIVPEITLVWDTEMYSYDNTNSLMSGASIVNTTGSIVLPSLVSGTDYTFTFFLVGSGTYSGLTSTLIDTNTITITLPTLL